MGDGVSGLGLAHLDDVCIGGCLQELMERPPPYRGTDKAYRSVVMGQDQLSECFEGGCGEGNFGKACSDGFDIGCTRAAQHANIVDAVVDAVDRMQLACHYQCFDERNIPDRSRMSNSNTICGVDEGTDDPCSCFGGAICPVNAEVLQDCFDADGRCFGREECSNQQAIATGCGEPRQDC